MTKLNDSPNYGHLRDPYGASEHSIAESDRSYSVPQAPRSGVIPRPLDAVLGIDYLTLKMPIDRPQASRFDSESTHRRTTSHRHQRGLHIVLSLYEGFDVDVHAYSVPEQGYRVAIWFNPSHHPANQGRWSALPVSLLPVVLDDVWGQVEQIVTPVVPRGRARVARIDIARDFHLTPVMLNAVLKALPSHDAPRATKRSVFHSSKGIPETCNTGTGSRGMGRAYDHAAQHGSPPGTLRTEIEVMKDWAITYGGITVVDDITPTSVEALFMNRYEYAGFHLPIVHKAARLERLHALALSADPILTTGMLPGFLGREVLADHGIVLTGGSSTASTRRKINEIVGLPHNCYDAPQVIRLDPYYDQPVEVAA